MHPTRPIQLKLGLPSSSLPPIKDPVRTQVIELLAQLLPSAAARPEPQETDDEAP